MTGNAGGRYDPWAAFVDHLHCNPDLFVVGGSRSARVTATRTVIEQAIEHGHVPVVAADVRGDHRDLIASLGGTVVEPVARTGYLDPLALGGLASITALLDGHDELQRDVATEVATRRRELLVSMSEILRGAPLTDDEATVVESALLRLDHERTHTDHRSPGIDEVYAVIESESPDLPRIDVAPLLGAMHPLVQRGSVMAQIFSGRFHVDPLAGTGSGAPAALVLDLSSLGIDDPRQRSAVMLAAASAAFGACRAAHVLAAADVRPRRRFVIVLPEIDHLLAGGPPACRHVLRLHDTTHVIPGTRTVLSSAAATGFEPFIERAGAVLAGGLRGGELDALDTVVPVDALDRRAITSWTQAIPTSDTTARPPDSPEFVLMGQLAGHHRLPSQHLTADLVALSQTEAVRA